MIGLVPGIARADTVTNNVTVGGNDTTTVGSVATVAFTLNATRDSTDPGGSAQCNAKQESPVKLTLGLSGPAGSHATASPSSLSFTTCGAAQSVNLSADTAGNYAVSVATTAAGVDTTAAGFTLHVKSADSTPPVLTLPGDQTVEATSAGGATVAYSATAHDAGDNASTPVTCTPASGSTFAIGTTTVSCSSSDSHGNTSTGTFSVTVQDKTAPALSLSDTGAEATSSAGAKVTFAATATDAVDGATAVTCTPASGSTFALGTTTVSCSSTDSRGNKSTGSLKVTVTDTTPPALTLPTTTVAEASSGAGATVDYTATAADLVDGSITPNCDQPSGTTFALGTTTVSCTATDSHQNKATGTFTVTVGDTIAPTLDLTSTTVEATGPNGAVATYSAHATDAVDGSVPVHCTPGSGSTFALGVNTVKCSAEDSHGNTAMGSLTVTVKDTKAPVLKLTDQSVEATSADGGVVTYAAAATDLVDGSVVPSCDHDSGATFPLGATTVKCQATDAAGNEATGSFVVTVRDTTPPSLQLADQTQEATSPHGAKVDFSPAPTATDAVDGTDPVTCTPASGSSFAVGDTTVTCTAGDKAGHTTTGTLTVTVVDTTAPTLTVADTSAEATGPDGARVDFTVDATDIVDGTLTPDCGDHHSGDVFPVGDTTFKCKATDAHQNFDTVEVTVTVTDSTPPEITTSSPTAEATGPDGAVVNFDATAEDLVDGDTPVTCTPASGSTFPLGTTTVTCTATDKHDNTATATAAVTVRDTTGPEVQVTSQTLEATGRHGAVATFNPTAHDLVAGDVPVSCDHASGDTYPIGDTIVKCSATDGTNPTDASFTITVGDHTAPALTLTDAAAEATGPHGAKVAYSASAEDLVDGPLTPSCEPASGSLFPIAVTEVTCSATDSHDNTGHGTLHVTVTDSTPPVLTVTKQQAEATGHDGAVVTYDAPTASDIVDGSLPVDCGGHHPGDTFAVGVTTVHCTATDGHGNTGSADFTVTVTDTTAPLVTVPENKTAEPTGKDGAVVSYDASAADLVDGSIPATCTPASGHTFPLGTTTVTCSATDDHGNAGSASFTVTVQDKTAPTLTMPTGLTAEATGPSGAVVTYSATATDAVDGTESVTCTPASGATFPLDTTVVQCHSTDAAGNIGDGHFTVTVQDKTAPALPALPDLKLTATSAAGAVGTYHPSATDAVDGSIPAVCTPPSGSTFKLGTTQVSCIASDTANNSSTGTFTVSVTLPWSGVLAPLNADGSSVFKIGSTVPVKFQLTGSAAGVTNLPAKLYYAKISDTGTGTEVAAVSTSAADASDQFRYDASGNQYIFNLSTKGFTVGTYQLVIDLGDGVMHTVNITSKK